MASRHPDELAADMRRFYHMDWRELPASEAADLCAVMIRQPESWVHRALNPDWQWGLLTTQLAAQQADALALLWWAKTQDGERNRNRPAPFPRPTAKTATASSVLPVDDLDALLRAPRTNLEG